MDTNPKETAPKGINWLTVFGFLVLAILIVIVIWAVMLWNINKKNPIIADIIDLEPQLQEMMDKTLSQIENEGTFILAADLVADPTGLKDRFVITEGAVSKEESMGVSQNIAMNIFSENENYNGYVLDDALVVIDITGEGPQVEEGTMVKAYGKLFVLNIEDVWKLSYVGPNLKQEFAGVEGMSDEVVFLICKAVKVIASPIDDSEDTPAQGLEDADGEAAPVDGEVAEEVTEDAPVDEAPAEDVTEEPAEEVTE